MIHCTLAQTLTNEHVKRHCQKTHVARKSANEVGGATCAFCGFGDIGLTTLMDQQSDDHSTLHCGWRGCEWESDQSVTKLELHVQKEHLREVQDTFCPFKGERELSGGLVPVPSLCTPI